MLTAFFAIIKDSFRAAMASRVLYVMLGLITLILLVLAPLHTRESIEWKISSRQHFPEEVGLALKLHKGNQADADKALKRIWDGLTEKTRQTIVKVATAPNPNDPSLLSAPAGDGNPFPLIMQLENGMENDLNALVTGDNLYEQDLWGKRITDEAKELAETEPGKLTRIQQRRLNRLLISQPLAPELNAPGASALEVWYGPGWEWGTTTFVNRQQFNSWFSAGVSQFFDKFVMSIGLFIAILVTSNLIPEMFEPGSLNLLLSKPVPRWLLLLGKFVGGCAFIALCAAYLFLGSWLWMGLAAGHWDQGLLWSIPLYIIVFAIYFSVSMLVGIQFRSAIVSVILTVVFWGACFATGSTWYFFNSRVQNDRIVAADSMDGKIMATDCRQRLLKWNSDKRTWDEKIGMHFAIPEQEMGINIAMFFEPFPGKQLLGPVKTSQAGTKLIGVPAAFDPEGNFGGAWKLNAVSAEGNTIVELGDMPMDVVAMIDGADGPLIVANNGAIRRFDNEGLAERIRQAEEKKPLEPIGKLFVAAGPDEMLSVRGAERVAVNPANHDIFVLSRNTLARHGLDASKKEYRQLGRFDIPSGVDDRTMASWLVAGGDTIVAGWGNGVLSFVDAEKMTETTSVRPRSNVAIEQLSMAGDGSMLLVLYQDGQAMSLRRDQDWAAKPLRLRGAKDIIGLDWVAPDQVLVCHSIDMVGSLNPIDGKFESLTNPKHGWLTNLYNYAINPFYQLAPKPGEFYKLVTHLSARANVSSDRETDLTKAEYHSSPWSPFWSGLLFMGAMLGLGCVMFARRDY